MGDFRIGFIGGGNMASAILAGLCRSGRAPGALCASDPSAARREALSALIGGSNVEEDNLAVVERSDIVVLAVKPQVSRDVVSSISSRLRSGQVLVSLCAGVSLASLGEWSLGRIPVVRVMPNTPALVGAGMSALAFGEGVSEALQIEIAAIFSAVGQVVVVGEQYMNAVTGLSGSGPAYVMLFIEALADGGVHAGLPRAMALQLAKQTVLGAAQWVQQQDGHPAVFKDLVTSPGGTTIHGVRALEEGGFRAAVMHAVIDATARADELS